MTPGAPVFTIGGVKRQAVLTKRRTVDLCRVSACLCPMP
jgi:hypothetical protein